MNWFPKIINIELKRKYFDGYISPTCTGTAKWYWHGYVVYKWLWFSWEKELIEYRDFEEINQEIEFKFDIPKEANVLIRYAY